MRARVRITALRPGVAFVPFHYGYWDHAEDHDRAANELTITDWDPVSKQPLLKAGAAQVTKLAAAAEGEVAPAPTTTASRPAGAIGATTAGGAAALVLETVES
jgi:hypothetical protein